MFCFFFKVIETGFAKQLLVFATYPECKKNKLIYILLNISFLVRSNSPLVKNFKFTTSSEDFEFKKFLINTIVILSRIPVIHEVYFIIFV
jgi:hypothetical protein